MIDRTALRLARYAAGSAMPAHEHAQPSFNIVVDGSFLERIGREERRYATGFVSYCPAGLTHSQQFGRAGARQIICTPRRDWLEYLSDCRLDLGRSPYSGAPLFRSLGEQLLDELRSPDDLSGLACEGMVLEALAAFARRSLGTGGARHAPVWLRTARDFLRENASAPLPLARVAQVAGRHEVHLAREFRRFFGTSIGQYLRRLRCERAAALLAQPRGTRTLTEVALCCGFSSHAHLCHEFRRAFGVTPSHYRRMAGAGPERDAAS
jgi:AraC family transcriptional regulator